MNSRFNDFFVVITGQFSSSAKLNASLSKADIVNKRVVLFDEEVKRQQALIARVEKFAVTYQDKAENETVLIMNNGISTPFNCAQHLTELQADSLTVAEVDGQLWDMHHPLQNAKKLKFFHMKEENPHQASLANKVFWRSCSYLLGAIIETSFKEDVPVLLHSFPSANVRSGSFIYDIHLGLKDWKPKQADLRKLGIAFQKLCGENHILQRLEVEADLALRIFEDNRFKSEQIPQIAANSSSGQSVTLYRVGNHIDISRGPMIASTGQIGRASVTAVHNLNGVYRFQGVALPKEFQVNHVEFDMIQSRGRKLNSARIPELKLEAVM